MSELLNNLKKLCEEHEKHLGELRLKIREIDYIPKAKALEGKCFKYASSWGFGGRKGWTYKYITGSENEYVVVDSFTIDTRKKIDIVYGDKEFSGNYSNKGLTPITKKEYFVAYDKLIKIMMDHGKKRG